MAFADDGSKPSTGGEIEAPAAPTVPQNVRVSVNGSGLRVKWDKLDGAKSYAVYRSYRKLTGWKLLKKGIKGSSYTDRKVKSGKKAYYKVRALKANGKYTNRSNIVSGRIYRVYIETGHGRGDDGVWDPGCAWNGYQEAKLMIPVCKAATKYLRAKGVYVYTDAYNRNNKNLNETLKFIKTHSVSVLLNVHCDYYKAPLQGAERDHAALPIQRPEETGALPQQRGAQVCADEGPRACKAHRPQDAQQHEGLLHGLPVRDRKHKEGQ